MSLKADRLLDGQEQGEAEEGSVSYF